MKKQGVLDFDNYEGRYIIIHDDNSLFNRSLHCGDVIEILQGGSWITARMEYNDSWYLAGTSIRIRKDLVVRV
jgi:hypothetical protein